MTITQLTEDLSVSPQITVDNLQALADLGFQTLINNRPDGEADDQPSAQSLSEAAAEMGMTYLHIPVKPNEFNKTNVALFRDALMQSPKPALAFCRTGRRSTTFWALASANTSTLKSILSTLQREGIDIEGIEQHLTTYAAATSEGVASKKYDVVIVGGGAGGIATAASVLKRRRDITIAIVEPKTDHYYQPGWTLVGAGVFSPEQTQRSMKSLIPKGVTWVRDAVSTFDPDKNQVTLRGGDRLSYQYLVAAPGIKLDWEKIEGLTETLGRNCVTSNYDFRTAPYTWDLVKNFKGGRAVFTQPPMPIKCAGAPQKALYLSCHHWEQSGNLSNVDVSLYNSGAVLFGVGDYVPALEAYIQRYNAALNFGHTLSAVDGSTKKAWFTTPDCNTTTEVEFDMLHVSPPQSAPDFIRNSPLANTEGWIDVSAETLRHTRYDNVFALGDACSAPNAKTAAAVRKQAPVVASNLTALLAGEAMAAAYDGYGSCPLTVEKGKIVLAEFGYGGKLLPSMPAWINDGTSPTRAAWWLKTKLLPPIYFDLMLKGREWMAGPQRLPAATDKNQSTASVTS